MPQAASRIPRSTCRLFGTIKALSTIKNAIILVHGPKGCVYHINYILGMRGDRPSEIFSTCLDEHDVIFGAEEKLTRAIVELDSTFHPDLLFVLSCCATGIIGEDVSAAVREASVASKAIAIDSGGFEGDHAGGLRDCLAKVAAALAGSTGDSLFRTVNLIGVLRSGPDLTEIRHIITSSGIKVNAVFTAGLQREQLARMGDVALNVVVCEASGLGAAEVLLEKFGTPYLITSLPIGVRQTEIFLETIRSALSLSPGENPWENAFDLPSIDPSLHIAIFAGPTRAIALSLFLSDLSCPPRLIVLDFPPPSPGQIREAAGSECRILVEPSYHEIKAALAEQGIGVILGGMLERPFAAIPGIRIIDVMHGSQRTVGYEGARILSRMIAEK
ncbi:MAG: nitrogenase component 1 [Methanoregulaceae archaeon]|nr:nitrogenase component 1 [Methanoregulaceae archaeon]MCU0629177.1 nitrogenase component 1 [Methanoregulaceae archaeon]